MGLIQVCVRVDQWVPEHVLWLFPWFWRAQVEEIHLLAGRIPTLAL